MLIDNPDAFKSWLTSVLEPLCDADPEALAKYVFALVKKDKSVEILRQGMLEQLDVFLQHETKPFVELLFKTIESQDYLLIPNTNPPNPNVPAKNPADLVVKDIKPIIPVSTLPNLSETINGSKKPEKEERRRRRSRSRSWDRQKRSKSRERDRGERSPRRGRSWRNKSPPSRRYRRSRSGSPPQRQRSRSRSPRHYRGAQRTYRNRSPPRSVSRSPSRSQERKDKREKDAKDENSGAATPTQDSNHGDTDMRLTSTTQSIQSVVQASGLNQPNLVTQHSQNFKKRCRDFDEKGYCMKGELCPYDHGLDPVVLEDSALTTVLQFGGETNPLNPPMNQNFKPIVEYNPSAPSMWQKNSFRPKMGVMSVGNARFPNPNIPGSGFFQRELIPVPVSDLQTNKRKIDKTDFDVQNSRKKFDFNRLGPKRNSQNCSLELKKIPKGLNNITHLNNHFSKFGKIVNIQVNYNNDLESALITFSCHSEANSAYKSTEAVLNNRFIKVFWHSNIQIDQKLSENDPPNVENVPNVHLHQNMHQNQKSVKDRLGKVEIASTEPQKSEKNNEKHKLIAKNQEILLEKEKLKRKQLEKRKEAIKITQDLRKRKQELLEKQLAQQKLLIEKLEKAPIGPQRDLLKTTIKTVQESIENIRKDISPLVSPQTNVPKLPKTKEDAQRELLDTELDLMTRQAEGLDTSALQRRLAELRATALSLSSPQKRGKCHKWGESMKNWREIQNFPKKDKKMFGAKLGGSLLNLDRRPTGILISGFELDELTSVVTHFANFGEIKQFIPNNSIPSVVLIYKQRKEAEMAVQGRNFRDRVLSVTWVKTTGVASAPQAVKPPLLDSAVDDVGQGANVGAVGPPLSSREAPDENGGRENGSDGKLVVKELCDGPAVDVDANVDEVVVRREAQETTDVEKKEPPPPLSPSPASPLPSLALAPPNNGGGGEESGAEVEEDHLLLEGDDENVLSVAEYTEEALLQDDEEEEETEEDRSWRR